MRINEEGAALIKSRESCRLKAYKCPAGVWTIGYGHTGPEVHEGLEITSEEADALFAADTLIFDAGVQRDCPVATPCQHSAMVSLAYNIGLGAFAGSSVARLHNAESYAEAAQAFAMWNEVKHKVESGLVKRRAAEAHLYLEDLPDTIVAAAPTAAGEKPMSKSRVLNGAKAAGAAVAGIPAVDQLHGWADQLHSWQDQVVMIQPYWGHAQHILIGIALAAILVTGAARVLDRHGGSN